MLMALGYVWRRVDWWWRQAPHQAYLSHNLQGGKKAFSLLCPDLCRSWHLCRLTIEDLTYSCSKRSGTWHFSWALSPDRICLWHSPFKTSVSRWRTLYSFTPAASVSGSVSAEFMNGKCQALHFFSRPVALMSENKGKMNNTFLPSIFYFASSYTGERAVLLGVQKTQTTTCSREDSSTSLWHLPGLAHWVVSIGDNHRCDIVTVHLAGLHCIG